ncbi:hypothetical protein I4F81_011436 [Pyropia yezoensis]|uniref:Uncharacterized protein n=1 Tax=Pyropia yezoensis TaxID=2788 RepID=A0ACC3CF88_PYRYE|nr:hypothetical protein I4F81_011436 [Neopyropia yezoensis]
MKVLRMRAAPLAVVWAHLGDAFGDVGGIAPSLPDGATTSLVRALAARAERAVGVLPKDVLAGAAFVAAELAVAEAKNLVNVAGPFLGVALQALSFGVRVMVAVRGAPWAAKEVANDLNDLHTTLLKTLLPEMIKLGGNKPMDDFLEGLGGLVAELEVLAGRLHYLLRSRKARGFLALAAAGGDEDVDAGLRSDIDQQICLRCGS